MFERQIFLLDTFQFSVDHDVKSKPENLFVFPLDDLNNKTVFPNVEQVAPHRKKLVSEFWYRTNKLTDWWQVCSFDGVDNGRWERLER